MKTTRRIFAVLVAVLMIAIMVVPFAADSIPTTNNTLTVNGKPGFTASVYKIADFNTTTGAYLNAKSNAVEAALNAGNNADLLTAANALTNPGDVVDSFAFTDTATSHAFSLPAGVYYVKWTTVPSNVTKAQNSVLVLPYFQNNAWVQTETIAASKTSTGEITRDKVFTNNANAASINANIGDSIPFTLTGSVPGSSDSPAYELKFNDVMDKGLIIDSSVNIAVSGTTSESGTVALAVNTNYTLDKNSNNKEFTITFSEAQLAALYTQNVTEITINYAAKLTADGVVIGGTGNPNTLNYSYKQSATSDSTTLEPVTKTVYTFSFDVKKVDANTNATITDSPATFELYSGSTKLDTKSTVNGIVTFSGLKDGTYKVVETVAPNGYGLNTKEFSVTISSTGTVTGNEVSNGVLVVPDPKVVLPNTGGAGTLLFTIGGIALIAGAAVLFVIYKKKASSK